MGTKAEATYYDNAYLVANPVRRSVRLETMGRIGQNTLIPWMRLLGLSSLTAEIRNVGTVSGTLCSYTAFPGMDTIPTELVLLRPFVARALGDLMRACGVQHLAIVDPVEDVRKDLDPTWKAFSEIPEPAVRVVPDGTV